MTHVHGGTHGAAGHAPPAPQRRGFAISLLGASALVRLAIVAVVSALMWLMILWALA